MPENCCWRIPLHCGVAILGVLYLLWLIGSVLAFPNSNEKVWSFFSVLIILVVCAAFAYVLIAPKSLKARRWLLYAFIGHRIC